MKKMNYHIIIEALYVCGIGFLSCALVCFIFIGIFTHKRDKAFYTRKGTVSGINTSGLKEVDVYLSSTGELIQIKAAGK